jgi:predicted Zn-dependent peptidase
MLDVGSRDENTENQGIAHFWEHMAFKGTRKRNSFHILNRLESVGGELNAFTDKEKICFFASLRDEYLERAIELLCDITFHSTFPKAQVERERHVILEEMAMYYDDPDGALQDEFDALLFPKHSMGMNILGTNETVKSFNRKHFTDFIKSNLDTTRIVLSVVGNVESDVIFELAEKYLARIPKQRAHRKRKSFENYRGHNKSIARPIKQSRCAIGRTAFSIHHEERLLLYFLNNILGGPGMNSKLNMSLREKHGYVYSVGSQFVPFSDTGIFVITFGTEPTQIPKAIDLTKKELYKLMDTPMGDRQLSTAKEQFMGQMAMGEENNGGYMLMMARNILDLGYIPQIDDLFKKIKQATAKDVQKLAQSLFDDKDMSVLVIKPESTN